MISKTFKPKFIHQKFYWIKHTNYWENCLYLFLENFLKIFKNMFKMARLHVRILQLPTEGFVMVLCKNQPNIISTKYTWVKTKNWSNCLIPIEITPRPKKSRKKVCLHIVLFNFPIESSVMVFYRIMSPKYSWTNTLENRESHLYHESRLLNVKIFNKNCETSSPLKML